MRYVSIRFLICSIFVIPGCQDQSKTSGPGSVPVRVADVEFKVGARDVKGKLFVPSLATPQKRVPGLLLLHEEHGLTTWEIESARRLAALGNVVLAIDLYGGQQAADAMDSHVLGRALPDDRVLAELRGGLDLLCKHKEVDSRRLGVLGWDMGGGYALDAACSDPRIKLCVLCYGRVVTDPALLAPLRANVLAIFAGKDEGITPETVREFRAAMAKAGKPLKLLSFPSSRHGFMNPAGGTPGSDIAIESAWREIETFLREGWQGT